MSVPLTVTDVKQYAYCPRKVYFKYVMPLVHVPTYSMTIGKRRHITIEQLEMRRSLRRYGLQDAVRRFRVRCYSARYNLSGILDMVLDNGTEQFPVEFKNTSTPAYLHQRIQLAAYALILEEEHGIRVGRGFIYNYPNDSVNSIALDGVLKDRVIKTCTEIREMIAKERMPSATRYHKKCDDCEWKRFCGDLN